MARPTYLIQLGLTSAPSVANASVSWTDISSQVIDFSWSGGKEHALNQVERSECSITVNNNTRAFDPTNASSPYYPNLKPRNRIRISLVWNSLTYPMFTGYIKEISVHWEYRSQVVIHGVDALALFNQARCYESPWEMEVRKDLRALTSSQKVHWYRLGDNSEVCKDVVSGYDGTYQGDAETGKPSLIMGSNDGSFSPITETRASIPRKDLITQFPFSVEAWIKITQNRSAARYILSAFDGPISYTQNVQMRILDTATGGADAGKVYCELRSSSGNIFSTVSGVTVDDGELHHIVWRQVTNTNGAIIIDGVGAGFLGVSGTPGIPNDLISGYAIGNTPAVVWGDYRLAISNTELVDEVVIWDGVSLPLARMIAHYQAGVGQWEWETPGDRINHIVTANTDFPVADRVIFDGVSPINAHGDTGSVLTAIQKVAETDEGIVFIDGFGNLTYYGRDRILTSAATFGVTPPDLPYHAPVDYALNDEDLYNEVEVSRVTTNGYNIDAYQPGSSSVPQVSRDSTSQSAYDRNVLSKTGLLHLTDAECKDHADWLLSHYKTPITRIQSLTVNPDLDPTNIYPVILSLSLHDRITLKVKPEGGGSTFTQDQYIEGYQWFVDRDNITVVYSLSPAFTQDNYFILDDFTYGLLDSNNLAF